MYELEMRKSVEKIFFKLAKRNPLQLETIYRKVEKIRANPFRYKNLKRPLQHMKRVHIKSSFVLVFSVDEKRKAVIIEDYNHHDNVYRK